MMPPDTLHGAPTLASVETAHAIQAANDHNVLINARMAIRDRLRQLDEVHASYLNYLHYRIKERDWHGAWDSSCNISETECEQAGLRFSLEQLGG